MPAPITDLAELLRSMRPTLNRGVYAFVSVPHGTDVAPMQPIATFREAEGLSIIVDERTVGEHLVLFAAAWITLSVHSDLAAVGLTAAVAAALARAGISCNVVAAVFHDHLFVPVASAGAAMTVLAELQASA
jgi:uncharacterized protein